MDHRAEVAQFLRSRRDRITPDDAGIVGGGRRRVPGLRREEVAMLTRVSVEYYARMERGDLSGVSSEVLDSLSQALQLDEAETAHLLDLAHAAGPRPPRRRGRPGEQTVRPSLRRFLDAITGAPVWIRDRRMNIVTANPLGRALYAPIIDDPASSANTARFMFLNPEAEEFFPEWERGADEIAGTLRSYAGQSPHDKALTDLIGELVTRSDEFRIRWAKHNVRFHRLGIKRIHHPLVGDLELDYEALDMPANPDWFLFAHTAEPGSATDKRLQLLCSLTAPDPASGEPFDAHGDD
ncbi:helix-turn-helix transcriptional regulator [Micromonospora sp. CB01531]|uniref:helix-turn-helix transcriptional regulator n=1 Tax=Micromonospora sp. CB01531 TaxID=1718947 RepID=UPI0009392E47|nr:helix-turn-helix transcriptional regulator [Micromonospora sp. CB01531]OKI46388.1 transcriptional regulator [Micromonospora sp. CB01531]